MKNLLSIALLLLSFSRSMAQDIPQGEWRTHFSYQNALMIETTSNKVFCAVENSLFYVDVTDNTVNILTKINGLSDVTVTAMAYSSQEETLIIGYESGNIDLFSSDGIVNIDLLLDQNLIQSKAIRDVHTFGQLAFLSTDFGIVVVDLEREVIDQVYREIGPAGIQPEVSATTTLGDSIFALTNVGLLRARISPNINLLDFNNWDLVDTPSGTIFQLADADSEFVYLADENNIFTYQNGVFAVISNTLPDLRQVRIGSNGRLLVVAGGLSYVRESGNFERITEDNELVINNQDIFFFDSRFWIADAEQGLQSFNVNTFESLSPLGPVSDNIQQIVFQEEEVFAFGPFQDADNDPLNQPSFSAFSAGRWETREISNFVNVNDRSANYFSSFGEGIYDVLLDEILSNTPIVPDPSTGRLIVTDIEAAGNLLWVANPNTGNSLHVMDENGVWVSFNLDGRAPNIEQIVVSGNIWIRNSSGGGVIILTPEASSTEVVNPGNSDLPSSTINDLAIDQDDEVWVATEAGVAFFPSASSEISNFNNAILPVFENRILFRDEVINDITVDPGNRKWIGNERGAWLLEESGESLVVRFTAENSPLPSNNVLRIAINPANGEVFFVTDKGMASFRSDATASTPLHGDVKVFPNPVTPGFSGLVGISGLATDVRLKITDVSGKLIRELEANGGTAAWDLRDINGRKARTGVYLFFSSDRAGQETFVGKIAVVN